MKIKTSFIFLIRIFLLSRILIAAPPNWDVNPSHYESTANMTAELFLDYTALTGGTNVVGVFKGDECRGVASPINIMNKWLFFITVYSNTTGSEEMSLRAYIADYDSVFEIEESIEFSPNESFGNPDALFELNTFLNADFAPSLKTIADQTITRGGTFGTVDLAQYLEQRDNDPVTWSYSGNSQLNVNINLQNIATITSPDPNWIGSENITFRVTEQTAQQFSASQTVRFTVLSDDHPPKITNIPEQAIGISGSFQPIDLNQYLVEQDGDDVKWDYFFTAQTGSEVKPNWQAPASNYEMSMTITGKVFARGESPEGGNHLLGAFAVDSALSASQWECRGVAEPVQTLDQWQYFLTIYSNQNGEKIILRFFDENSKNIFPVKEEFFFNSNQFYGTPTSPMALNAGFLTVNISTENTAQMSVVDTTWTGSEAVYFIAQDEGTLYEYSDSSEVEFTILNDHHPSISTIPEQVIEQGESFTRFDLDQFLTEVDGDPVIWNAYGDANLQITINAQNEVSLTPVNSGWLGTEQIMFEAQDNTDNALSDFKTTKFSIVKNDTPPMLAGIPDQEIVLGNGFAPISLTNYLTNSDNDSIVWDFEFPMVFQKDTQAAWSVQPSKFELSMTITAVVTVRCDTALGANHKLAAFVGEECRGVAAPTQFMDKWLYFLTVYSDISGENVVLKFYESTLEKILPVEQNFTFSANSAFGEPLSPVLLDAGLISVEIDESKIASINIIDDQWIGSEQVLFIATDFGTPNSYADSQLVNFTISATVPVELSSFSTTLSENSVILFWTTASESNNYGFFIERRNEKENQWQIIGFLKGNGTTSKPQNYVYTDNEISTGTWFYRLKQQDNDGQISFSELLKIMVELPTNFSVSQNFPNPFNSGTKINYTLSAGEDVVTLEIFDIMGHHVKTLIQNEKQAAGNHQIIWDGTEKNNISVPSGFYFYRLSAGKNYQTLKMLLIK